MRHAKQSILGDGRQPAVEALEGRTLMAASPLASHAAVAHPAAKAVRAFPTITGSFTGQAGANLGTTPSSVRLAITSETSRGVIAGRLVMAGGNTTINYPMVGTVGRLGTFNLHATTPGHRNTRITGRVSPDANSLRGQFFGSMVAHRNPHTTFMIVRAVEIPAGTKITAAVADNTFKAPSWTTFHYGGSGSGSGAFSADRGNPDAAWYVTNEVDVNYMSTDSISQAIYSPAVSGAVQSLTFKYDFVTNLYDNQGQGTAPAILQNGIIYVLDTPDYGYPGSWKTELWTNMTADRFIDRDNADAHPDFSSNGAPMQFGFTNANFAGALSHRTTLSGFDNFSVTINAIEPSA